VTVNKSRSIDGRWWIHGDDKPCHYGVLSFDPESGLELVVKIPQDRTVGDALHKMFQAQKVPLVDPNGVSLPTDTSDLDVPKVIHGRDEHNYPVTLFGCSCLGPGVSTGLDSYRIDSLAAILNFCGDSWSKARFQSVRVSYSLLHDWMNWNAITKHVCHPNPASLEYKNKERREFTLDEHARLAIEGHTLFGQSATNFTLNFVHYVEFEFDSPIPVKVIQDDYVLVFLQLLCLLTGENVFIEEMLFWDSAQPQYAPASLPADLLRANPGIAGAKKHKHADGMVASFAELEGNFGGIVKRWFECHTQLEPVSDLYFIVLRNLVGPIGSQFLLLAQALEVYHARSFPGNKRFDQRIQKILDLHPSEAAKLTEGISDFAMKVYNTRNYLTHYDEKTRQSGKVAEGNDLVRVTYALKGLLLVCFLKELGIQGNPIDRVLRKYASMRFVSLDP
jgi:hypothetical protein